MTRKSFLPAMAVIAVAICVVGLPLSAAQAAATRPALVAYIGPGAGLGFLGSLLAVLMVVVLGLVGLVLYPVKLAIRWLRRMRGTSGSSTVFGSPSLLHSDRA